MKIPIILTGISLVVATLVGVDNYQQRISADKLQTQVKHLSDQLKQQIQATADIKKQLTHRLETVLLAPKEKPLIPQEKIKIACEASPKAVAQKSYQDEVLTTLKELDGATKADALRELITLAKLKKNKQITKVLLDALNDENPRVRSTAVMGIRKLKMTEHLQALDALIYDPNDGVRITVLEAFKDLESNPEETGAIMMNFFDDTNERIASRALRNIATLNYSAALPQINQILTGSENLRVVATAASVARSLGDDVAADSALPRIATGLNNPMASQRLRALQNIINVGGNAAIPYLRSALTDPDEDVRDVAQSYLEEIETGQ